MEKLPICIVQYIMNMMPAVSQGRLRSTCSLYRRLQIKKMYYFPFELHHILANPNVEELDLSNSEIVDISFLKNLYILHAKISSKCVIFPVSITYLNIFNRSDIPYLDLSYLTNLTNLYAANTDTNFILPPSLKELDVSYNTEIKDLSYLPNLVHLNMSNYYGFEIRLPVSLKFLQINSYFSTNIPLDISYLVNLQIVYADNHSDTIFPKSLHKLSLKYNKSIKDLSYLSNLQILNLEKSICEVNLPRSLTNLNISGCIYITNLKHLVNLSLLYANGSLYKNIPYGVIVE